MSCPAATKISRPHSVKVVEISSCVAGVLGNGGGVGGGGGVIGRGCEGGCDGEEAIVKAVSPGATKPESTLPFLRVHSPVGLIVKPLHSWLCRQ